MQGLGTRETVSTTNYLGIRTIFSVFCPYGGCSGTVGVFLSPLFP
jgi:hypothetical protein